MHDNAASKLYILSQVTRCRHVSAAAVFCKRQGTSQENLAPRWSIITGPGRESPIESLNALDWRAGLLSCDGTGTDQSGTGPCPGQSRSWPLIPSPCP